MYISMYLLQKSNKRSSLPYIDENTEASNGEETSTLLQLTAELREASNLETIPFFPWRTSLRQEEEPNVVRVNCP